MTSPPALSDPEFADRYRAISSRDRRFDGQFVTAVRSTGIYCRPSCPARTPKPDNVTFYRTSAAAHAAGFRACKRCLPEAVPGTPEWDSRSDLASRAMRLVRDGVVDREGVSGLASRLGYTSRHIYRILVAELGAGPLALARAQRAQTARALVTQTDLSFADVAFAAGFGSIRQFNDTMTEVFALSPSQLRARAGARSPGGRTRSRAHVSADLADGASIRLALPHREPYDAPGIIGFLAARAVSGVESVDIDALTYARTLALPHGPGAFEATADTGRFHVRLDLTSLADLPVAIARIRHLLDLDADPLAIDEVLGGDPALRASVLAVPGIRLPGAVDGDEILVRALIGQQISVAAARTHLTRLTAALGTPTPIQFGVDRLFPTATQLAAGAAGILRGPTRRIESFHTVVAALAAGQVVISRAAEPSALRSALQALPGVGPWTAGYVAMRVLHDPDVLLATDRALLLGAEALGLGTRSRGVEERGSHWSPWRSYAAMHLWRAALVTPPSTHHTDLEPHPSCGRTTPRAKISDAAKETP